MNLQALIEDFNLAVQIERQEKEKSLKNHVGFTIFKQYKDKNTFGERYDEFEVEDYDTAIQIIDSYRLIGHNINLMSISLYMNDKQVKKVNFKY